MSAFADGFAQGAPRGFVLAALVGSVWALGATGSLWWLVPGLAALMTVTVWWALNVAQAFRRETP